MKSIFLIAILGFVLPANVEAQSLGGNRLLVKFSPLSLHVPYVGRSLRLGCEYKIKEHISLENEFGFFFDNSKGYLGKMELKFYSDALDQRNYFSGELYFKNQYYTTSDSFGLELREYNVTKNVECLTFKYGTVAVFKFGFLVDAYIGLGIRFQQNENTLTQYENDHMESTSDYGPNLILNRAGNRVYPNFTAGIKIGFRIIN